MPRTVEKILKDDEEKLDLGVETEVSNDELIDDTASAGPTPEETAAELKKQLADANARADREAQGRKDAEAVAATASTKAGTAVQSQLVVQERAIDGRIALAKTNLDSIKQQLKQAKASGDSDAEVELSDELTNARYELNNATWEKQQFGKYKEEIAKQPIPATTVQSPYTAKEQSWISEHPEFSTNKKFARLAKMSAQEALDEGHKQDSPGYFKYIEDVLRENNLLSSENEPLSGAGTTTTSVAAAPSRTGNGATAPVGKNAKYPYIPSGFRIPADWVEAATNQGFDDPREYANDRLKIEADEKAAR